MCPASWGHERHRGDVQRYLAEDSRRDGLLAGVDEGPGHLRVLRLAHHDEHLDGAEVERAVTVRERRGGAPGHDRTTGRLDHTVVSACVLAASLLSATLLLSSCAAPAAPAHTSASGVTSVSASATSGPTSTRPPPTDPATLGRVEGHVYRVGGPAGISGQPSARPVTATVTAKALDGQADRLWTAEGTSDGHYELILPAGIYELSGTGPDGRLTPQTVTVPAGGTVRKDLQFLLP